MVRMHPYKPVALNVDSRYYGVSYCHHHQIISYLARFQLISCAELIETVDCIGRSGYMVCMHPYNPAILNAGPSMAGLLTPP
jgi:hypothetical protein